MAKTLNIKAPPLCEFVNKAGTGSRQFLPDSPDTAMFYRLVGYIA